MRLVHLAGYGGPYAGSFIPMLRAVIHAAEQRGWRGELVFGPTARDRAWLAELRGDGIQCRIAPHAPRTELTRFVSALLDESDAPAILHTHFTTFDVAAVRAARRRADAAVIWHVHSPHGDGLGLRARNRLKYALLGRRVERILCVSTDLVEVVTSRGAPPDRIDYVPNAIDAGHFAPASHAEREQARRRLGLEPGIPVLAHFGWDWERKGGDLFCEAVARLAARGREVVGVTVGSPARGIALASGLGLSEQTLRVCDAREDVRLFYAAADVFVAPSRGEGTPYAVLEAVSSGTAVVASDISGHADIGAGVPGCRLVPLEAAAVAEAAAALVDRPAQQVQSDARAGHEWVRRNRDLVPWTEALMQRYEALRPPEVLRPRA